MKKIILGNISVYRNLTEIIRHIFVSEWYSHIMNHISNNYMILNHNLCIVITRIKKTEYI